MSAESANTAEAASEPAVPAGSIIAIHTMLGDEDDDDVHRCGRCQAEFTSLEAFIQHKLQNSCQRAQELLTLPLSREDTQEVELSEVNSVSVDGIEETKFSSEKAECLQKTDQQKEIAVYPERRRRKSSSARTLPRSPNLTDQCLSGSESAKIAFKVNEQGRYICQICDKTFKTANILRTHLNTHSEEKNFQCKLCSNSFRTKGSLIRHNRRHTNERPYRCNLCGISFRESGALTRHLKSITPCTEKTRFSQCREILVNKDGVQKGLKEESSYPLLLKDEQLPVVDEVENTEETIHEVHVQEQAEAVQEPAGDSLISQAIMNSGIMLGADQGEQQVGSKSPKPLFQHQDPESRITEIQVTEECVELDCDEAPEPVENQSDSASAKGHRCFHCNRVFRTLSYLRTHVKGHLEFKPFKCSVCDKEFLTGYLLKKHMEVHLSERRFKCGECGKLYKTIGHVREHMRAHSDERPYHCNSCDKGYKTKNALQVHQRTHAQEKPYVCQYCSRGFREKGSLVRHIRHHTGEKPFTCYKCGRGFAEHGTLSRHLRAKGGCSGGMKESEQMMVVEEHPSDSDVAATIITEDPHAVLVEFSSVVADTQEYIIQAPAEVTGVGDAVAHNRAEVDTDIMKVVQQLVNQSNSGHQVIVQNVSMADSAALASDCGDTITIATPESLTEQVAMTLASAISDGAIMTAEGTMEVEDNTVTMVASQDIEVMEQSEEFVITSPEEVEIQTIVQE
ncbi:transcription factor E4F1 [Scleropages formosus]|uniref:Transcription factor E4F1 n=1 Tax=Scleropages formosus TaxID=113540 RepID=A0A8C9SI43_SCLFO|nr:transcription factor E4F1 [Scleropages formosus]